VEGLNHENSAYLIKVEALERELGVVTEVLGRTKDCDGKQDDENNNENEARTIRVTALEYEMQNMSRAAAAAATAATAASVELQEQQSVVESVNTRNTEELEEKDALIAQLHLANQAQKDMVSSLRAQLAEFRPNTTTKIPSPVAASSRPPKQREGMLSYKRTASIIWKQA